MIAERNMPKVNSETTIDQEEFCKESKKKHSMKDGASIIHG